MSSSSSGESIPDFRQNPCVQVQHMSTIVGQKLYVIGGYEVIAPSLDPPAGSTEKSLESSSYLRIYDVFNITSNSTVIRLPDEFPRRRWGSLWGDSKRNVLYLYGGSTEFYPIILDESYPGTRRYGVRPPYNKARSLWVYDIATKQWEEMIPDTGDSVIGLSRANQAIDTDGRVAYVYGGGFEDGQYIIGDEDDRMVEAEFAFQKRKELITFDFDLREFKNHSNEFAPMGSVGVGAMVHLDLTSLLEFDLGAKGVLILFGGEVDFVARSIEDIHIYDIQGKTWYTQRATAQSGNFPTDRQELCAVAIPSPDKSSYNIYITGGYNPDIGEALSDVWVLTLPAFHWIYLGEAPVGKIGHTCEILGEGYMLMYGGRQQPANSFDEDPMTICDTPSEEERMYLFDVSKATWIDREGLDVLGESSGIPEAIYNVIGGGPSGEATVTSPRNGWVDEKLGALFATSPTPTSSISIYPNTTPTSPSVPPEQRPKSGSNKGLIIALTLGVVILILVAVFFFLFYRRRRQRPETRIEKTEGPYQLPDAVPAPTTEMPSGDFNSTNVYHPQPGKLQIRRVELQVTTSTPNQLHELEAKYPGELEGTSPSSELDAGLSPNTPTSQPSASMLNHQPTPTHERPSTLNARQPTMPPAHTPSPPSHLQSPLIKQIRTSRKPVPSSVSSIGILMLPKRSNTADSTKTTFSPVSPISPDANNGEDGAFARSGKSKSGNYNVSPVTTNDDNRSSLAAGGRYTYGSQLEQNKVGEENRRGGEQRSLQPRPPLKEFFSA